MLFCFYCCLLCKFKNTKNKTHKPSRKSRNYLLYLYITNTNILCSWQLFGYDAGSAAGATTTDDGAAAAAAAGTTVAVLALLVLLLLALLLLFWHCWCCWWWWWWCWHCFHDPSFVLFPFVVRVVKRSRTEPMCLVKRLTENLTGLNQPYFSSACRNLTGALSTISSTSFWTSNCRNVTSSRVVSQSSVPCEWAEEPLYHCRPFSRCCVNIRSNM